MRTPNAKCQLTNYSKHTNMKQHSNFIVEFSEIRGCYRLTMLILLWNYVEKCFRNPMYASLHFNGQSKCLARIHAKYAQANDQNAAHRFVKWWIDMASGNLPQTVTSRAVVLRLSRKSSTTKKSWWWHSKWNINRTENSCVWFQAPADSVYLSKSQSRDLNNATSRMNTVANQQL